MIEAESRVASEQPHVHHQFAKSTHRRNAKQRRKSRLLPLHSVCHLDTQFTLASLVGQKKNEIKNVFLLSD